MLRSNCRFFFLLFGLEIGFLALFSCKYNNNNPKKDNFSSKKDLKLSNLTPSVHYSILFCEISFEIYVNGLHKSPQGRARSY